MEHNSGEELLIRLRAKRQLPLPEERRRIRVEAKASLRDVAEVCGVSHMAVHNWENGATPHGPARVAYVALLEELKRVAT
jgi:transcriptional regulator with XRE-family HTH domain